jgi:hypothetical protein
MSNIVGLICFGRFELDRLARAGRFSADCATRIGTASTALPRDGTALVTFRRVSELKADVNVNQICRQALTRQ